MAGSALRFSSDDPHYQSKGLLGIGRLAPIVQVWTRQQQGDLYNYYESGSFILFLVQGYGIEKFKTFYSAMRRGPPFLSQQDVEQAFYQTYHEDLASVEAAWHRFLESYAPGLEQRAEYLVQTLFLDESEFSLLDKLRVFYGLGQPGSPYYVGPIRYVGPVPERVYRLTRAWYSLYLRLASDPSMPPEQAFQEIKANIEVCDAIFQQWWAAVQMYIDARALIFQSAPYDSIISKLQESQWLYQAVGDEVMAENLGQYIAAYQFLSEGESLIGIGEQGQARSLLLKALTLFCQLNEPKLAQQVRLLLLIL